MKGKKSSWPAELSSATSTLFVNQYAQGWFMGEPSSLGCFCNSLLDLEDASFGSPLTAVHSTPGFCLSTLLGSFFIPSDGTVGWELLKTYLLTALLHRIWSGPLKTRSLFHQSLEMLASLDSLSCYQVDCSSQLLAWDFFFSGVSHQVCDCSCRRSVSLRFLVKSPLLSSGWVEEGVLSSSTRGGAGRAALCWLSPKQCPTEAPSVSWLIIKTGGS